MARYAGLPFLLGLLLSAYACGSTDPKYSARAAGGEGGEAGEASDVSVTAGAGAGGMSAAAGAAGAGQGGATGATGCAEPANGPTVVDADVTEETTWTADGSPYVLAHGINVRAPLVIEPCVDVLLPAAAVLLVRGEGSVEGRGTPEQPIRFGPSEAEPWGNIRLYGRPLTLTYTTIEGGGELGNVVPSGEAMIDAQGEDGTLPTQGIVSFDHVTLRDSANQGILLRDGAGFSADSQELSVTGSGTFPVAMWGRAVGTLPTGVYTGNAKDAIFLIGSDAGQQAIQEDATLFNRGVPYEVGGDGVSANLNVGAIEPDPAPLLTIEPGVTIRFAAGGHLYVGNPLEPAGSVSALGTEVAPITFTSAATDPIAGDWWGIYIFDTPDGRTKFDHVIVEYAGGASSSGSGSCLYQGITNQDAAIRFMDGAPPGEIVTNSEIRDSAGHGIDRGWIGAAIDFTASNTFVNVKNCVQTLPKPDPPTTCPISPPCDAGM
jgi:hypothetical protein